MKLIWKIAGGIVVLLLMLVAVMSVYLFNTIEAMRPDRGEAYQARMHYLPDPVPATTFDLEGTEGWMKRQLHNELIDKGPYLVSYPVAAGEAKKAIIVLPGGGYVFRSEQMEGVEIAQWLNDNGIAAFILNYRLQRHPVPLSDVQSAIRYIRNHATEFNIQPDSIGVMGFSAGGHLAASTATMFTADSRPDFAVLAYPVIYMDGPFTHTGSALSLIGDNPSQAVIDQVSPHKQVTADTPPVFVWAPRTDTVVPWENSKAFADALAAKGVEHALHLFPEGGHGSALARDEEYASAWPGLMLEWLNSL
jgi:acetyl esterase/lipase